MEVKPCLSWSADVPSVWLDEAMLSAWKDAARGLEHFVHGAAEQADFVVALRLVAFAGVVALREVFGEFLIDGNARDVARNRAVGGEHQQHEDDDGDGDEAPDEAARPGVELGLRLHEDEARLHEDEAPARVFHRGVGEHLRFTVVIFVAGDAGILRDGFLHGRGEGGVLFLGGVRAFFELVLRDAGDVDALVRDEVGMTRFADFDVIDDVGNLLQRDVDGGDADGAFAAALGFGRDGRCAVMGDANVTITVLAAASK